MKSYELHSFSDGELFVENGFMSDKAANALIMEGLENTAAFVDGGTAAIIERCLEKQKNGEAFITYGAPYCYVEGDTYNVRIYIRPNVFVYYKFDAK